MTANPKKKARYRIGVVEEMTGLTRDTIHMYVRDNLLSAPERESKTTAWYTLEQVRILRVIRVLREQGIPLPVIERLLIQKKSIVKLSVARLTELGQSLAAAGLREIRRNVSEGDAERALAAPLKVLDRLRGNAQLAQSLAELGKHPAAQAWVALLKDRVLPDISAEMLAPHDGVVVAELLGAVVAALLVERSVDVLVDASVLHRS